MTLRTPPRGLDTARGAEGAGTRPKTRVRSGRRHASCEQARAVGLFGVGRRLARQRQEASRKVVKTARDTRLTLQPIGGRWYL